ncbi:MAG: PTS sugar transporter subunit IIA [Verrucomicrobia bacterium]|nr:PTS sugar transporter subunit IIA [Verrucomicrobiota bacterium]
MNTLCDSLLSKDVKLQLKATDHHDALEEILSPLRSDVRVRDWQELRSALLANSLNETFREVPGAMFLHHCRTESVSELVLAAGRSTAGIVMPGREERVHLIFVAAIPEAVNNEYLRILGAISRICSDQETMQELLDFENTSEFLTFLERACRA